MTNADTTRGFYLGVQSALEVLAIHDAEVEMDEIVATVHEDGLGAAIAEEGSDLLKAWWAARTTEDEGGEHHG